MSELNVLAIILARKGSKRLPGKNKKRFNSKPLLCWSIEQAMDCKFINEIIVSTDDEDIVYICQRYWREDRMIVKERPPELATDTASSIDAILDALKDYSKRSIVILLQPTSPLRLVSDIESCFTYYLESSAPSVVSWSEVPELECNGAVYIATIEHLEKYGHFIGGKFVHMYLMPKERSIDIDTLEDFEEAEKLMKKRLEILER